MTPYQQPVIQAKLKKIPRFNHYFEARLYMPERTVDGKIMWEKSVREIT